MSAVIYLATASERIREFFISAAFGKSEKAYENGIYQGQKRSWYTTPFIEAKETLIESSPELTDPLRKAYPLADQIRGLRDTRNELIHEIATAIGRRERRLLDLRQEIGDVENFTFEDLQKSRKEAEAKNTQRISGIIDQLANWYLLLARLSNEAFIVEHNLRLTGVR